MIKLHYNFLTFLLILILGIIPVVFSEFGASSLALGLVFLLLLFFSMNIQLFLKYAAFNYKELLIFYLFSLHFIISSISSFSFKAAASLLVVVLMVFSAKISANRILIKNVFDVKLVRNIFYVLLLFLIVAFLSDYQMSKIVYGKGKGVFPFGEPSNFALFFGPFFIFYIVLARNLNEKLFLLVIVASLAVLVKSITLLVFVALGLFLFLRLKYFVFVVSLIILGLFFILNDPYFISRLALSADSDNLTALVYLQGLFDAYSSIVDTSGFGLGFQMLGTQPPSDISYRIMQLLGQGVGGGGLNRQDGGFVAAKLTAEFGLLGLILLSAYLGLFVRVFLILRKYFLRPDELSISYVFSLVFVYSTFVEIFVRGTGYFSPTLFLFITALYVHRKDRLLRVHSKKRNSTELQSIRL